MANDILLFADDTGANVLTQVAYAADTQRTLGNQAGIARSAFVNKVLRQTSFMSVALAQLIVDKTGSSVLDDGDDAVLLVNMKKAVNGFIGSNIASATTTTIGAESSGDVVHVTGTTTITSLGASTTGTKRTVIFDGILTLTYNATSLILPSAANITTSAGSAGVFVCTDGALGYWKCISYSDDVVNKAQLKTYFDTLYSAVGSGGITLGTAVASTSGTSIDFTGIPASTKRITVMFDSVSTNGTSMVIVQLGSTTIDTASYTGTAQQGSTPVAYSTGFLVSTGALAASSRHGIMELVTMGSNIWTEKSVISDTGNTWAVSGAGRKTLSGTLDRIRITTVNGTDTFDAGLINIMYEG